MIISITSRRSRLKSEILIRLCPTRLTQFLMTREKFKKWQLLLSSRRRTTRATYTRETSWSKSWRICSKRLSWSRVRNKMSTSKRLELIWTRSIRSDRKCRSPKSKMANSKSNSRSKKTKSLRLARRKTGSRLLGRSKTRRSSRKPPLKPRCLAIKTRQSFRKCSAKCWHLSKSLERSTSKKTCLPKSCRFRRKTSTTARKPSKMKSRDLRRESKNLRSRRSSLTKALKSREEPILTRPADLTKKTRVMLQQAIRMPKKSWSCFRELKKLRNKRKKWEVKKLLPLTRWKNSKTEFLSLRSWCRPRIWKLNP